MCECAVCEHEKKEANKDSPSEEGTYPTRLANKL